jgi:hypothetical protein
MLVSDVSNGALVANNLILLRGLARGAGASIPCSLFAGGIAEVARLIARVLVLLFAALVGVGASAGSSWPLLASAGSPPYSPRAPVNIVSTSVPTPVTFMRAAPIQRLPIVLPVVIVADREDRFRRQQTASAAWQSLAPELAALWGIDTPRTVAMLDTFISQFPDDDLAKQKLYAALVASGEDLDAAGAPEEAAAQFRRADRVQPERLEARRALLDLNAR